MIIHHITGVMIVIGLKYYYLFFVPYPPSALDLLYRLAAELDFCGGSDSGPSEEYCIQID